VPLPLLGTRDKRPQFFLLARVHQERLVWFLVLPPFAVSLPRGRSFFTQLFRWTTCRFACPADPRLSSGGICHTPQSPSGPAFPRLLAACCLPRIFVRQGHTAPNLPLRRPSGSRPPAPFTSLQRSSPSRKAPAQAVLVDRQSFWYQVSSDSTSSVKIHLPRVSSSSAKISSTPNNSTAPLRGSPPESGRRRAPSPPDLRIRLPQQTATVPRAHL
jgi:hypothetical protein